MANIRWLGPPEHAIGLIGYGTVTPGDIISVDSELADRLVKDGRAEEVDATEDKKSADKKSADKKSADKKSADKKSADTTDNPDGSAATKTSRNAETTGKVATDPPTQTAGEVDQERASAELNKDKP